MDTNLILLTLLILASAAFSGAEIAFTSLSQAKVRALKNDNLFASKAIFFLKTRPESLLITILIGNNLSNILAAVFATIWGVKVFGNAAVGIVTGGLTFFILVFGEITPKTIAQKYALRFARILAYPLLWFFYILFPVIWLFEKFIHGLMRIFKAKSPIRSMSEEELLALVDIGTTEGIIEKHEKEFITNVLEFTDTTVEEVMTLEKDIDALEINTSIKDAIKFFLTHSHSRIPVYRKNLNNIKGILMVHDVLRLATQPKQYRRLSHIKLNPPILVPKTKAISTLFRQLQAKHQHLAIVVDEYGETVGLVSLEDILEEIVGEIVDEQDKEFKKIKKTGENSWETFGDATIEEIQNNIGVDIDYPEHQNISLLILEQLHRFPHKGEKIAYGNLIIQVKAMGKKKIEKISIVKLQNSENL